jgi:hypothetical protein
VISGSDNFGQDIAQAFHGFFGAGLTLIGAATLAAAIFEHQGIRPSFLTKWRVKDLGAFGLADPAAWGAAMGSPSTVKPVWRTAARPGGLKGWPGADPLASMIASAVFVAWWTGAIHVPDMMVFELRGEDAVVTAAPIWATLYGPILIYALVQIAVDLVSLMRPYAVQVRAALQIPMAVAGLWLVWTLFQAGHWFDMTRGNETARIAGDWVMLDPERLRTLGDGTRDLVGVSSTLSVVMTWVLAGIAVSMASGILRNLWRLIRG